MRIQIQVCFLCVQLSVSYSLHWRLSGVAHSKDIALMFSMAGDSSWCFFVAVNRNTNEKKMLSSIWNLNPPSNNLVSGIVSELNYSMTEESHQETGLQIIILLCIHMGVSFFGIILFKYKLQSLFMFVFFESIVPKTISGSGTLKHKFV